MMTAQKTSISDDAVKKIMSLPTIAASLPYRFPKGARIDDLSCICAYCGASLEPASIRAEFTPVADGSTVLFKGFGVCYGCKTFTPLEIRFNDDGSALCRDSRGFYEQSWGEPQSIAGGFSLVIRFCRQYWNRILPPALALIVFLAWQNFK